MKTMLLTATLAALFTTGAVAQTSPAAPPAPAAPAATLGGDSPIEAVAATPAGKASLEKNVPGVLDHPAYQQFKGMSLRAIAPLSGGIITDEKIAAVEADLRAAN